MTRIVRTDRIVIQIRHGMLDELRAITSFIETHTGLGHDTFVALEGTRQTLACKCGVDSGAAGIGDRRMPLALAEDEIIDDG